MLETVAGFCFGGKGNVPILSNAVLLQGIFPTSGYSPTSQIGFTSAQISLWFSDSLVLCKPSIGIGLDLKGSVTMFARASSLSDVFSYDLAATSSLQYANSPIQLQRLWNVSTQDQILNPLLNPVVSLSDGPNLLMTLLRGKIYGTADLSVLAFDLGHTNCETTGWISTSAMYCRRASGISGSSLSICSVALGWGTLTELFSFDSPLTDSRTLSRSNTPTTASILVSFGSLPMCLQGYYYNATFPGMLCTPCLPGSICPGTNKAIPCPAGSWNSGLMQTTCSLCQSGTYQDGIGATACKACPLQGQNTSKGAISVLNCTCPNSTIPMSSWFLSKGICPRNISNTTSNVSYTNISTSYLSLSPPNGAQVTSQSSAPIIVVPVAGGFGLNDYSQSG